MTEEWRDQMLLIEKWRNCGQCKKHCSYQLDTPQILRGMLKEYQQFYASHHHEIS